MLMCRTPVLLAVPWSNIESWRLFASDLGKEIILDGAPDQVKTICAMLIARLGHDGIGQKIDLDHVAAASDRRSWKL